MRNVAGLASALPYAVALEVARLTDPRPFSLVTPCASELGLSWGPRFEVVRAAGPALHLATLTRWCEVDRVWRP